MTAARILRLAPLALMVAPLAWAATARADLILSADPPPAGSISLIVPSGSTSAVSGLLAFGSENLFVTGDVPIAIDPATATVRARTGSTLGTMTLDSPTYPLTSVSFHLATPADVVVFEPNRPIRTDFPAVPAGDVTITAVNGQFIEGIRLSAADLGTVGPFSVTAAVPEPATWGAFALGGVALLACGRRRLSRRGWLASPGRSRS